MMVATTCFVHISAVERAGLGTLREGQKISYEIVRIVALASLRPTICAPLAKGFLGSAEKSSLKYSERPR